MAGTDGPLEGSDRARSRTSHAGARRRRSGPTSRQPRAAARGREGAHGRGRSRGGGGMGRYAGDGTTAAILVDLRAPGQRRGRGQTRAGIGDLADAELAPGVRGALRGHGRPRGDKPSCEGARGCGNILRIGEVGHAKLDLPRRAQRRPQRRPQAGAAPGLRASVRTAARAPADHDRAANPGQPAGEARPDAGGRCRARPVAGGARPLAHAARRGVNPRRRGGDVTPLPRPRASGACS